MRAEDDVIGPDDMGTPERCGSYWHINASPSHTEGAWCNACGGTFAPLVQFTGSEFEGGDKPYLIDGRGRPDAEAMRDEFLAAKNRHIAAIELARMIVVDPNEFGDNAMAKALVDIDETMRSVLTDDR